MSQESDFLRIFALSQEEKINVTEMYILLTFDNFKTKVKKEMD